MEPRGDPEEVPGDDDGHLDRAGTSRAATESGARSGWAVPFGTLFTLAFSFFAVGVTVSVALVDRGTPTVIILGAAVVVFSATSELAYVAVRDSGGSAVAAVLSGWLVASRFGLLATALGNRFGGTTTQRAVAALCSVDPNVAVAVERAEPHEVRRAFWWTTAALFGGWWVGSITGIVLGNVVSDIQAWGIDAIFPAALLAIIGPMLRRADGRLTAVLGAGICLVLTPLTPGGIPILASVIGALIAVRVVRGPGQPEQARP